MVASLFLRGKNKFTCNYGLNDVQWGSVGISGLSGFASGAMGSAAGQAAGNGLGSLFINNFKITSPIAQGIIGGAIGGAAGGYAGGFAGTLMAGGDVATANRGGISGATSGAFIGGMAGGVGAYAAAKKAGVNPWTGEKSSSTNSQNIGYNQPIKPEDLKGITKPTTIEKNGQTFQIKPRGEGKGGRCKFISRIRGCKWREDFCNTYRN
ncbi:MAG TPA: hypothetical protein VL088_07345 [Pedobacter sp.]|nr:hypothetical protein [Pedobacter sp.]